MASIEHRKVASGDVWRVRFRHAGKNNAVTFTDAGQAEKWRRLVEVNVEQALAAISAEDGTIPPTVADQVERHIRGLTGISGGTRGDYSAYLENDIRPHAIGGRLLRSLNRDAVADWVNWLEGRGQSGKTITNKHSLLSAAMATAVADGLIPSNPCKGVRLPRTSHLREEMVFLNREEFAELFALVGDRYKPLILLLVATGMRFGEATALRVSDVDLADRSITVRRAWKRTRRSAKELGPTKSRRSDRTVALPAGAVPWLQPLIEGRSSEELLFTNAQGGEVKQATFWTRVWQPAVCAFAGDEVAYDRDKDGRKVLRVVRRGPGKHPRIHDLRHSFVSWAIRDGHSMFVIQRQLGHESFKTTADTYGHLARADLNALVDTTGAGLPAFALLEA